MTISYVEECLYQEKIDRLLDILNVVVIASIRNNVDETSKQYLKGAHFVPVGSVVTGCNTVNSDIDVNLVLLRSHYEDDILLESVAMSSNDDEVMSLEKNAYYPYANHIHYRAQASSIFIICTFLSNG